MVQTSDTSTSRQRAMTGYAPQVEAEHGHFGGLWLKNEKSAVRVMILSRCGQWVTELFSKMRLQNLHLVSPLPSHPIALAPVHPIPTCPSAWLAWPPSMCHPKHAYPSPFRCAAHHPSCLSIPTSKFWTQFLGFFIYPTDFTFLKWILKPSLKILLKASLDTKIQFLISFYCQISFRHIFLSSLIFNNFWIFSILINMNRFYNKKNNRIPSIFLWSSHIIIIIRKMKIYRIYSCKNKLSIGETQHISFSSLIIDC